MSSFPYHNSAALSGAFGRSRAVVGRNYAFLPPEGILESRLPTYDKTLFYFQTAPVMGARFAQAIIVIAPAGGTVTAVNDGLERFFLVLAGEVDLKLAHRPEQRMVPGAYAYIPSHVGFEIRNNASQEVRILALKRPYERVEGLPTPESIVSNIASVERVTIEGNPGLSRQSLLPLGDMRFDMEMNVLSFQPGATFPAVETHVMEHGLYMLHGEGLYMLGDRWHDIKADDFIWMGSYVPQLFYATGSKASAYLLYKDVNRDVSFGIQTAKQAASGEVCEV